MNRTDTIEIKVTTTEAEKMKSKAEKLNMTVSSYLRFLGLGARIKVIVEENDK